MDFFKILFRRIIRMNSGKIGWSTRFIELWPLCDSFHSFQSNTATVILLRQTSFQIFRHFRCSLRVMNSTEKKKSKNNQITVINVMIWATWTCGHLMILRWWYDRFKWTRFWTFFKKSFRRLPRWSAVSALPASFPDGGRRGKWWIWMKILQSGSSFGVSFCFWFVSDVETLHFRPAKRPCRPNWMRKMNGNYFWEKKILNIMLQGRRMNFW